MHLVHFNHRSAKLCVVILLACLFTLGPGFPAKAGASPEKGLALTQPMNTSIGTFHVSGRFLLDANGNNLIMRGISEPYNWYPSQTSSFQNIKAKGANTVRVVLSSGQLWPKNSASDVASVIKLCKANKLICVLEVHDTTGYKDDPTAVSLAQAVSYWKEIKSVLIGQEAYVMINIGNEPYGNVSTANWVNDTKNAVLEMRNAGFQHTLIIDAPNWGQDWQFIMRDNAASLLASDPLGNIVFSIHMYGVFNTAAKVDSYLSTFVNAGLPLIIGEFGDQHTDGDPDEDAIMAKAVAYGIGYLGWSWSGNTGGDLDMVTNFDPNQETWWGDRIIDGPNGIRETSVEATVYKGTTFGDVPFSYPYYSDIEILYANGLTGGCQTTPVKKYCPDQIMDRGQAAVFMLRGRFGSSFVPGPSTHVFKDDWAKGTWAEPWADAMYTQGLSAGCSSSPLKYCPWEQMPREQAVIFALRMRYGTDYIPPAATGTMFADMTDVNYFATPWAEQAYKDGLIPNCGTSGGKPMICPKTLVSRGLGAYMIVRAKNLTMP
jgi:mannan endo-1,4-beta-mannosidase